MAKRKTVTFQTVRKIVLALPAVEEGLSHGTPAFRVKKKFMARLREDGETLVVRIDPNERDFLMQSNPTTFFITDHYRNYPTVLVRLGSVTVDELEELLDNSWRMLAPAKLTRKSTD